MPSSRVSTIPYVIHAIKQLRPTSILDVGVGFGKWGYLFREYTDVLKSECDPGRYYKNEWRVVIEGIEAYEAYVHSAHEFIYDKIHVGKVQQLLPNLGMYDVVFFGDIIEHLALEEGQDVLKDAKSHARRAVIVTTPRYDTGQEDLCANVLETHRSVWNKEAFEKVGNCRIAFADRKTLVVMFPCDPGAMDVCLRPERPLVRSMWIERLRDWMSRQKRGAKVLLARSVSHNSRGSSR
jgi:hypothetical protein